MYDIAPEVVSIAEACLGGLQGRSALLIGLDEQRYPYTQLLWRARMKYIYQEDSAARVSALIPQVQLFINLPACTAAGPLALSTFIKAADIARGCEGRRTPLLIFDLAPSTSVEELAGLLPAVCLYTPDDINRILTKVEMKAS
ncbi:MAG: hypothetical protein NVS2B12_31080 [Ktedonobacteraceae bacterium]